VLICWLTFSLFSSPGIEQEQKLLSEKILESRIALHAEIELSLESEDFQKGVSLAMKTSGAGAVLIPNYSFRSSPISLDSLGVPLRAYIDLDVRFNFVLGLFQTEWNLVEN